ncbi:AMP-binding protein [Mycolicibacterium austroafricanum]|nr:AMP-binding protein [Mycolicibacterium austroafricanum]
MTMRRQVAPTLAARVEESTEADGRDPTLAEVLEYQAARRANHSAVVCGEQVHTFRSLNHAANRVANALSASGVLPGHRVAFWGRSCLEAIELVFGAAKAGVIPVMVNWRLGPREGGFILADSRSRLVVVDTDVAVAIGTDLQSMPDGITVLQTGSGETYEAWRDGASDRAPAPRSTRVRDEALQLYTSGTTGHPKGVLLTAANCQSSIAAHCEALRMGDDAVQLIALPLFHIGGLVLALASVGAGSTTLLVADADPFRLLTAIRQHGVTHLPTVPTMLADLLDAAEREGARLPTLRTICYGSAPMPESVLRRAISMLDADLLTGYGMTETTATVTFLDFDDHRQAQRHDAPEHVRRRLHSVGRTGPFAAIKIIDPATLQECPRGVHGEVLVRGPQVMKGYWNRNADNDATLLPGGWIRTGDGGFLDRDGYLFLTDRIKDMIISGGENVYPAELENVVAGMAGIAEVAVIGVPDDRWGETPKVMAVRRAGADLTTADVLAHCRARLAHYKCPSTVEWLDELPRTASGKVLKHVLRERDRTAETDHGRI